MRNSNEAVTIVLKGKHRFHPLFTYAFFGESEQVPDDASLTVIICPSLNEHIQLEGNLQEPFLPIVKSIGDEFKTEQLSTFSVTGRTFEVHIVKENIQEWYQRGPHILSYFFIEGASTLGLQEDANWVGFSLYERIDGSLHWVGFCTAYRFPMLFSKEPKVRFRLSQFVVLPPWQGQGVAVSFYTSIMRSLPTDVEEVTVENPTSQFEGVRLCGDAYLAKDNKEWVEARRLHFKLCKPQWERLRLLYERDQSDAYRLRYKRYLIKTQDLPADIEERKKELHSIFEADMQCFDRIRSVIYSD